MPVLINKESGLAENLPTQQMGQAALDAGTHELPLVDPEGNLGSAPLADAHVALSKGGYQQPRPEQLQSLLNKAHYASTSQHAIGLVEQVGQGLAGPLATGAELALGVSPEDIRGREEQLGTAEKMAAQGLGLGAGMFFGTGEARVLELAGQAGLKAVGIGAAKSTLGRIGTVAAKAAIENAVYQSGDEISKAMLNDPNQTVGSAIAHVGLAGIIGAGAGGVLGAVPEVWSRTMGPKLKGVLDTFSDKVNGVPSAADFVVGPDGVVVSKAPKTDIGTVAEHMDIAPEIKAAMSESPTLRQAHDDLVASGTAPAEAYNQTVGQTKEGLKELLGKTVAPDAPMTGFEAGEAAKKAIQETNDAFNASNRAAYDKITPSALVPLEDTAKLEFAQRLSAAGSDFGAAGSPASKLFENYGDRVLSQKTIGQLDKLDTEIGSEANMAYRAGDFEKKRALSQIQEELRKFKDATLDAHAQTSGVHPDAVGTMKADREAARAGYAKYKEVMGDLFSVAKMGKAGSYTQIADAIDAVPSAKLAEKLFDPKNIEGLRKLQSDYPEIFKAIVNAKKTALIEGASTKGELMHNQLLDRIGKLPKEVKELMFTPDQLELIQSSGNMLRQLSKQANPSGTAKTLDKLLQYVPSGVGAAASMLLGHNPIAGYILGHMGRFVSRDAPDAIKVAMLKFMGSENHVDAGAMKAAVDFLYASIKGENDIAKATKAVLKSGQIVLPQASQRDREKLDKKLLEIQKNPEAMMDVGGSSGHYLPKHQTALAYTAANAANYLNQLRPNLSKAAPFDSEMKLPKEQEENFHAALDIANNPLIVLQKVKEGTLLPSDITHLNNLYPGLQAKLQKSLMEELTNHVHGEEKDIPYGRLMALSQFMGQPLESSLMPGNMIAMQSQLQPPLAPQGPAGGAPKHSMKGLDKLAKSSMTASQSREMGFQSGKR